MKIKGSKVSGEERQRLYLSACICVWTWPTDLKFSDDVLIFPTFPLVDSFLCKPFEENGIRLPVRVIFGLPFEK